MGDTRAERPLNVCEKFKRRVAVSGGPIIVAYGLAAVSKKS